MAYQVNGNVVIDDEGQGFFDNYPLILKPENLGPVDASTTYGANTTLTLSNFSGFYQLHANTQFQISNSADFAAGNIVEDTGFIAASNTYIFNTSTVGTYYWRGRYKTSNTIISDYSDNTSWTIGGLTDPPDGLGCPFQGGYFTGNIDIGGGVCYYLVLSPNASGCSCCPFKGSLGPPSPGQCANDGYFNTYTYFNSATYPAGNWTATRSIGGFSDWYLPGGNELLEMYVNRGSMPVGEGYAADKYWGQDLADGQRALLRYMNNSSTQAGIRCDPYRLRAIRRVPR